jgi:hypothetical protein
VDAIDTAVREQRGIEISGLFGFAVEPEARGNVGHALLQNRTAVSDALMRFSGAPDLFGKWSGTEVKIDGELLGIG